jgi:hypothetical protein
MRSRIEISSSPSSAQTRRPPEYNHDCPFPVRPKESSNQAEQISKSLLGSLLGLLGSDGSLTKSAEEAKFCGVSKRQFKRGEEGRKDVPESVLEPSVDILQVSGPGSTGTTTTDGLQSPLERPDLGGGESTGSTGVLLLEGVEEIRKVFRGKSERGGTNLLVERPSSTPPTEGVGLGVSLTCESQGEIPMSILARVLHYKTKQQDLPKEGVPYSIKPKRRITVRSDRKR